MKNLKLNLFSGSNVFLTKFHFNFYTTNTYKNPLMGVFVISSPLDQFQIYPVLGSTITNFLVSGLLSLIIFLSLNLGGSNEQKISSGSWRTTRFMIIEQIFSLVKEQLNKNSREYFGVILTLFVGITCWAIMPIASLLTYIHIGWGYDANTFTFFTNCLYYLSVSTAANFMLIMTKLRIPTGFAGDFNSRMNQELMEMYQNKQDRMMAIELPESKFSMPETKSPSTPSPNFKGKGKPTLGGGFLIPFLVTNQTTYGSIITDMGLSINDPFILNVCSLYINCCLLSCLFIVVTVWGLGLYGIYCFIYSYCYKFNSLNKLMENYTSVKVTRIFKWCLIVMLLTILLYFFDKYGKAIIDSMSGLFTLINTNYISHFYYNPPGLAMGYNRVLHIADYSWPFKFLNEVVGLDLNPDYILTYITFIKYLILLITATLFYLLIAYFTTMIYSQDKTALSLPNGPASLNLFTKCFYLKKPYKFIFIVLVIITLMLILVSYLLYVYLNIYVKG